MSALTYTHGVYANLTWREYTLAKKGDSIENGKYDIDYALVLMTGSLTIEDDNDPIEAKAPAVVELDKSKAYKIIATKDKSTYFLIFATKDIDQTRMKE